jgi:arylsulfatase A
MTHVITVLVACSLVLFTCETEAETQTEQAPPNIVVILADDLGIECLSLYGGVSHQTPNLDKLARQGMTFSHCFSAPYCSPSRAMLLSGRYPFRNGIKEVIWDLDRHKDLYLHTDQPSLARQLKQAGYTTAIAGKWQLSFLHDRNFINDFGFDQYQCWQIFDRNGDKTRRFHQPTFNRDGKLIHQSIKDLYGPNVNVAFLSDFIKTNAKQGKPFFAYYTCLLPHFPWVPTPDSKDKTYVLPANNHKGDPKYFPDMVAYLDKCVGRMMDAVEEAGVADNTVLIFLADNGTQQGLTNRLQNGTIVKGGKGTMTDLGTRVPLIVRWPGKIKAGTTSDDMVDFTDFMPTLCAVAGARLPEARLDGQSFLPQLLGEPGTPRSWVHIQDKHQRHIRSRTHILTDRGQLRPVVGIGQPPAPIIKQLTPQQTEIRRELQKVFEQLDRDE